MNANDIPVGWKVSPACDMLLRPFQRENDPLPVFGLWPSFRIAYINSSWTRFAAENGEPAIFRRWRKGRLLYGRHSNCAQALLSEMFIRAIGRFYATHPLQHEYECSSQSEFRRFLMNVYPLEENQGFLVANSVVVQNAIEPRLGNLSEEFIERDGELSNVPTAEQ